MCTNEVKAQVNPSTYSGHVAPAPTVAESFRDPVSGLLSSDWVATSQRSSEGLLSTVYCEILLTRPSQTPKAAVSALLTEYRFSYCGDLLLSSLVLCCECCEIVLTCPSQAPKATVSALQYAYRPAVTETATLLLYSSFPTALVLLL